MPAAPFRRAAERLERQRRFQRLMDRYGSVAAVIAPCEREQAIMAAVAPWRVARPAPYDRWTASLGASRSAYDFAHTADEILRAIGMAYPMPVTFRDAQAEAAFWEERGLDLEAVLNEGDYDDFALDLPALYRSWLVRAAIESELKLTSLQDIADRIRAYQADDDPTDRGLAAIFRDVLALASKETV